MSAQTAAVSILAVLADSENGGQEMGKSCDPARLTASGMTYHEPEQIRVREKRL